MNPTHYYLDCNNSLQTKNKLQAEFAAYLQSLKAAAVNANVEIFSILIDAFDISQADNAADIDLVVEVL